MTSDKNGKGFKMKRGQNKKWWQIVKITIDQNDKLSKWKVVKVKVDQNENW